MSEIKMGGGHYRCDKCGNTVFGSKVHICTYTTIREDLLYHLLWMIEQYCGYAESIDDPKSTRYNADAYAVMYLVENGYAEIVGDKKFPETNFMDFVWTDKAKEIMENGRG